MAYWPTRTDVKLPDKAIGDLVLFANSVESLPKIIEASLKQPLSLTPNTVIEAISNEVDVPRADLRRLFNTLENFLAIQEELGSIEKALDRVLAGSTSELKDNILANKPAVVSAISLYNRDNPISVSFKSQRLTYLRDKLYHEAEILTDVRPIFDRSGKNILEFVVTHDLVMTYFKNGDFVKEHISVDNLDIIALRKACDRALLKSKTVEEALGKDWKIEVLRNDT